MSATFYQIDGTKESRELSEAEILSLFSEQPETVKLLNGNLYHDPSAIEENPHFAQSVVLEDGSVSYVYPYKGLVIIKTT